MGILLFLTYKISIATKFYVAVETNSRSSKINVYTICWTLCSVSFYVPRLSTDYLSSLSEVVLSYNQCKTDCNSTIYLKVKNNISKFIFTRII